jgi:hypothetical protein
MRRTIGLGIGLALLLPPAALRADDDLGAKFAGTYLYQSGKNGTEDLPKDELEKQTVNITKDTITLIDLDGREAFVIKYAIRPGGTEGRCELDMEITESMLDQAVGSKAGGLMKKDGETVTIIYNAMSEDIPKDFEPEEGQHLFVLNRKAK